MNDQERLNNFNNEDDELDVEEVSKDFKTCNVKKDYLNDKERLAVFDRFFAEEANHKFWNYANEFNQLSIEFVEYFMEFLPTKYWKTQARKLIRHDLDEKFADHFADKIYWPLASKEMTKLRQVDEELIRKYDKYWDWIQISKARLSETLIDDYTNYVSWTEVSMHSKLSENFIRKHDKDVNWDKISEWQRDLSEKFIREYSDKVDWKAISQYQKLSESFMIEFADKVDWFYVSKSQKLSERFMHRFQNELDWGRLSRYQVMSEKFIRDHKDKVKWNSIFMYQKTSDDFKEEFSDEYKPYEDKLKKKGKGVRAQKRKMAAKAILEDEWRKERGFETESENFKYSKRPSGKPILRNEEQIRQERSIVNRSSARTVVKPGDRYTPVTRPTIAKEYNEARDEALKKKF